ncbi:MAG: glutathione peroxidase, partial [Bacteroidota bacterium]
MKTLLSFIIAFSISFTDQPMSQPSTPSTSAASFHEFSIEGLLADQINMSDYAGKYILCVNVASKCGYTRQYEPLQELYDQYQEKLVIIGFPSNQFGGQEPGTANEIATFCQKNYGVSFPMTQKIDVKGKNQHPIYAWLTQKSQNQVSDA